MREKRKWFLKKPLIHFFFNTHYPDYWKWWWSWWLFLSRTNWIYFARFIGISELLFRASSSPPHPLNARLIRGLATSNLNPGTGMETGRTQSHQPANSINFSYLRPVNALFPSVFVLLDIRVLVIILSLKTSIVWRTDKSSSLWFLLIWMWDFDVIRMFSVCLFVIMMIEFRSDQTQTPTQIENEDAAGWYKWRMITAGAGQMLIVFRCWTPPLHSPILHTILINYNTIRILAYYFISH